MEAIPNKRRQLRGPLRTRNGQTTGWRDGESLLNHITAVTEKKKKKNRRRSKEEEREKD